MTDILTRLAALTKPNKNNLLPCPFCNSASVQITLGSSSCGVICMECLTAGPESTQTPEEAAKAWNTRETALIALVQEAVGEIERLTAYLRAARNAESKMDVVAITDEAFGVYPRVNNPHEATNGKD